MHKTWGIGWGWGPGGCRPWPPPERWAAPAWPAWDATAGPRLRSPDTGGVWELEFKVGFVGLSTQGCSLPGPSQVFTRACGLFKKKKVLYSYIFQTRAL